MKRLILPLISLFFAMPGYSFAATQNIHMEWTYDFQPVEGRILAGYYLYKEGVKVCTSNTPTDRVMDCSFESDPGSFDFTLTAFSTDGYESLHSTPYFFTLATVENTPPTAVISSPTTTGEAPLTVSFDGSGSHDTEGPIKAYLWSFGDGSQTTTGATATHRYTVAGTYSASLTVTDGQDATNTLSIPVTITGQTIENLAPTARLTASVIEGTTPLKVLFDGSNSTDPENSPLTYSWNFGDGASGQGATATHIYTSPGSFTATLTVTDDSGAKASTTATITNKPINQAINQAIIATITTLLL